MYNTFHNEGFRVNRMFQKIDGEKVRKVFSVYSKVDKLKIYFVTEV